MRLRGDTAAIGWTIIRLLIGWQWLVSGWNKIGSFDASGFIENSINTVSEPNTTVLNWYVVFLEKVVLEYIGVFNFLVSWGEFLIGLGLILGMFTTSALFTAALLNFNFMLAGATSINPILYTLEIILIAVRPATYRYGLDFYFMPKLKEIFSKSK